MGRQFSWGIAELRLDSSEFTLYSVARHGDLNGIVDQFSAIRPCSKQ